MFTQGTIYVLLIKLFPTFLIRFHRSKVIMWNFINKIIKFYNMYLP